MTGPHQLPPRERGAALLTVLLLVAVMAVVSATAIERLTLATRLAASSASIDQARQYEIAAEALAMKRIVELKARGNGQTTLAGDWMGKPFTLPLPGGAATLTLTDSGNCFNVNSLVADSTVAASVQRPLASQQFVALMIALGIDAGQASRIAAGASDWIDADQTTSDLGAEDSAYTGASPGYRTPDKPMVDASELTGVAGVTPPIWRKLEPWVCALPTSDLSPINVNTLLPEQAPLLQMLLPARLSPAQARAHLAARPADGYGSINRFWSGVALAGAAPTGDVADQVKLDTRWFRLRTTIRLGDVTVTGDAIIDAERPPARVVARRWGPES